MKATKILAAAAIAALLAPGIAHAADKPADKAAAPIVKADPNAEPLGERTIATGGNGVKIAVYSYGKADGPAILFVHGVMQSHLIWNHQYMSALAKTFRIVTFDQRGMGESDKPTDAASYNTSAFLADDVQGVITALNLKKVFLVGWSSGGFVVCDYLRKYGDDNLSGINFIAASTKRNVPGAAELKGKGSSTGKAAGNLRAADNMGEIQATVDFVKSMSYKGYSPEELARITAFNMLTPVAVRGVLSNAAVDNADVLQKVKVPTLLTYGTEDVIVNPVNASKYVGSQVKGSKLTMYKDAGHVLFIDQAAKYNAELGAFAAKADGVKLASK